VVNALEDSPRHRMALNSSNKGIIMCEDVVCSPRHRVAINSRRGRNRKRDASACIRRYQAFAPAPVNSRRGAYAWRMTRKV
jgi:hypothetical protein